MRADRIGSTLQATSHDVPEPHAAPAASGTHRHATQTAHARRRPAGLGWRAAMVGLLMATAPLVLPGAHAEEPTATEVLSGLDGPVDFAVLSDGTIWWNEYYTGDVKRHDPATGDTEILFHADPIEDGMERGLIGLAVTDDLAYNDTLYVYYTVADPDDPQGGTNHLSRITAGEETVLLTTSASQMHNGGRILVAPDGSLFVSTGDNERPHEAQDPSSKLGKILHIEPDGSPAPGNLESVVYSMGHRNVYGLAYDADQDRLYATENSNAERDEVNIIEAGGNYGWPHCEGFSAYDLEAGRATGEPCDHPDAIDPIGEFYPDSTTAPTGAAVLGGELFWAAWNQGQIHHLAQNGTGGQWEDTIIYQATHRVNDLEAAPDGESLYFSNWTHIMKLELPDDLVPVADPPGPASGEAEDDDGGAAIDDAGIPWPGVGLLMAALALMVLSWTRRRPP